MSVAGTLHEILLNLANRPDRIALFLRFTGMKKASFIRMTLPALFAAALFLSPHAAMAQIATGSSDPVLPDPVQGRGAQYPPSAVTTTEAYMGPPHLRTDNACTSYNPCALPSSAPHRLGQLSNSGD